MGAIAKRFLMRRLPSMWGSKSTSYACGARTVGVDRVVTVSVLVVVGGT